MAIQKVLILAANPLETARLRVEKEVEEIRKDSHSDRLARSHILLSHENILLDIV
ncbi:hypothetical protein APA_602 [Pseudanabaena sp. lw0831]|uniref:hypothetical protein n=1 Tax=Pseudanabaena sp. lw0831 TaxID=1357935 RepID=UPI00191650F1|nr:hypothetical protein [Pseudanabaena sp. lw0831]GBO52801.1 hypothetical protein APA_602 [Pseudanabaena sp. lw0831]